MGDGFKKVKVESRVKRQVEKKEGRRQRRRESERYRRFCVPHGFIPFFRPFIHTPSLAHSVIVTLAPSLILFTPFLFSSSPVHPRSIRLRPSSRAHRSPRSPHLSFNSFYFELSFLLPLPVFYLFEPTSLTPVSSFSVVSITVGRVL